MQWNPRYNHSNAWLVYQSKSSNQRKYYWRNCLAFQIKTSFFTSVLSAHKNSTWSSITTTITIHSIRHISFSSFTSHIHSVTTTKHHTLFFLLLPVALRTGQFLVIYIIKSFLRRNRNYRTSPVKPSEIEKSVSETLANEQYWHILGLCERKICVVVDAVEKLRIRKFGEFCKLS